MSCGETCSGAGLQALHQALRQDRFKGMPPSPSHSRSQYFLRLTGILSVVRAFHCMHVPRKSINVQVETSALLRSESSVRISDFLCARIRQFQSKALAALSVYRWKAWLECARPLLSGAVFNSFCVLRQNREECLHTLCCLSPAI